MALYKLCRCGKRIEYTEKCCKECTAKVAEEKRNKTKEYNNSVRKNEDNKKYTDFYNSDTWRNLSEIVKNDRCGIDIYAYYVDKRIEEATITHHLREIKKDGWNDRLSKDNLVGLSHASHEKIHSMYKKDYKGTIAMLQSLMEKWDSEFG